MAVELRSIQSNVLMLDEKSVALTEYQSLAQLLQLINSLPWHPSALAACEDS